MDPRNKSRNPAATHAPVGRREKVGGGTDRAPRYAVELPVQYRPMQGADWRPGRTANVSRTGLLFETEESLAPDSMLEITLKMPVPVIQKVEASVVCLGRVVRVISPAQEGSRSEVAATIVSYYFLRETATPDA